MRGADPFISDTRADDSAGFAIDAVTGLSLTLHKSARNTEMEMYRDTFPVLRAYANHVRSSSLARVDSAKEEDRADEAPPPRRALRKRWAELIYRIYARPKFITFHSESRH